jgi:choline dehydrogenase-like flavoprotein
MTWDTIIIGSGFGGAMAAHALVRAGQRVLMLERGTWVERGPDNWAPNGVGIATPHFTMDSPYDVRAGRRKYQAASWHCVGGQSVFYGGASYRFRERDFQHDADLLGESGAAWPFGYGDIEPYYTEAERLLGVAGESGCDPTEPFRSEPFPNRLGPLSSSAQRIADAGRRLGLTPSRIPLAIAYASRDGRTGCVACGTCDGYACAIQAKSDVATAILPELIRSGLTLRTNTVCTRLVRAGSRITEVECVNRESGERERFTARRVILAAGTLATPHLILASALAPVNPAGASVGRYLIRHRNAVVFGVFGGRPNAERGFDKHIAFFDFYDGAGCIQQMTPPVGLVGAYVHRALRVPAKILATRGRGLLIIAEDQPQKSNGITVDWSATDRFGLPRVRVRHAYSPRDKAAAKRLTVHAKRILREAGARFCLIYPIETFSHALGTMRMGVDPRTSPLDEFGRYRGLDNLYVVDGSALPRSAGVNPSLTIAANALRIGTHLAKSAEPARARDQRTLPVWHNTPTAVR